MCQFTVAWALQGQVRRAMHSLHTKYHFLCNFVFTNRTQVGS